MRITPEAAQKKLHLLVHHGVVGDAAYKVFFLHWIRQIAVKQQVAGIHKVAFGRKLFDRIAAIQKLALIAIDEGNGRVAGRRRHEARVIGKHAGLGVEFPDVDDIGAVGAAKNRQFDRFAISQGQDCVAFWIHF